MLDNHYNIIVIGAGAAGLFFSSQIRDNGHRVLILERNARPGQKIRISGGGRCNFTNLDVTANNFLSSNEHFSKSALSRYQSSDFIDLVRSYGIDFFEKTKGQLFCSKSSSDILNLLLKENEKSGTTILYKSVIKKVDHENQKFLIETEKEAFTSDYLVIASGGLSFPGVGASDLGLKIAKQFKIKVSDVYPALVPFKFEDPLLSICRKLSGTSIDVKMKLQERLFQDPILFTHRGLSGPGVLQLSLYWKKGDSFKINFLNRDESDFLNFKKKNGKSTLRQYLKDKVSKSFSEEWISFNKLPESKKVAEFNKEEINNTIESFFNFKAIPISTEGYKKAEVMRGGVLPEELSSKTMEAKKVRGLYFIGEVIDVTGQLGGFNFQWAWSSAYAASESINELLIRGNDE